MLLLRRFIKLFLLEFLLLYIDKKHRPPSGGLFSLCDSFVYTDAILEYVGLNAVVFAKCFCRCRVTSFEYVGLNVVVLAKCFDHVLCLLSLVLVYFPIYLSGLCPFVPYTAKDMLSFLLAVFAQICLYWIFVTRLYQGLCLSIKPEQKANKSFLCGILPLPMLRLEAGFLAEKR